MSGLSRRTGLFAAAVAVAGFATATMAADAPKPAAPVIYKEFIWGDPKSKVTVIEYASLTCPHCADFANTVFPDIKKNYIDTGKIRFVFRDYPLDGLGMAGAALARCAPEGRGQKMIELMYKNQNEWARSAAPIEPLKGYAALSGMSSADVDACLKNEALLKEIKDVQTKASTLYQVQSTPTFYINDEKLEGLAAGKPGYEALAKVLDKHVAKAK